MPTKDRTQIAVNDGRTPPAVADRRLFQLERSFDPPVVDLSTAPIRRVVLHLPDNHACRSRGPGIYLNGNITKIIHVDGCNFPLTRCRGECTAQKVAP